MIIVLKSLQTAHFITMFAKNKMKKKFPKKAKLIVYGGFYKIIKIKRFDLKISVMVWPKIELMMTDRTYEAPIKLELIFQFERVFGGYAEYKQINTVTLIK